MTVRAWLARLADRGVKVEATLPNPLLRGRPQAYSGRVREDDVKRFLEAIAAVPPDDRDAAVVKFLEATFPSLPSHHWRGTAAETYLRNPADVRARFRAELLERARLFLRARPRT